MKTRLLKASLCLFLTAAALTPLQAQVLDKTPLLHLSFDNVVTTATATNVINDGTGGATMNGVLNSSANGTATIVPGGKFGNALQILGSASPDASCRIANAVTPLTIQPTNAFTVACWIQSTTPGGTWMYQGSGNWGVDNTTFAMVVNNGTVGNNGTAAGGVRNSRGWQQGTTVVADGAWHHIVFTYDGTNKVQYIDGVVDTWVANQWNNTPVSTGNQFWIGGAGTGQNDGQVCLNGLIDEAYVFNRALSQSDVLALYDSNSVPHVPLVVSATPNSGYRGIGQTFTVTAIATPPLGFNVTNATVNLTGIALSNNAPLVLSNNNVFTNTFTIPANAPIGLTNLPVKVIDTEPLIGSAGIAFTVVARPVTNLLVSTPLNGPTNPYAYTEVTYNFVATNNSPDPLAYTNNYSWYKNGVLVTTNNMGPFYTFLCTPADNGATIQCIANITDTNYSSIAVTSGVITMVTQPGALVYTNGLKREFFDGQTRANVEIGNVPKGFITLVTNADFAGGSGLNYSERYSGYFIPPTNGNYVFIVAADDDTDVFLSTDSTAANKRLVCQETVWSSTENWSASITTPFGSGSAATASQKRSDQWTNSLGVAQFSAGIPMVGGQLYYMESVHHNGTGGDNWGVTYSTVESIANIGFVPDGTPSLLWATNNNIAVVTWPGTNIVFTQTLTPKTAFEGDVATFTAIAVSDAEAVPSYTWYVNGVPVQNSPNGTNFALPSLTLAQNGAQITVVAYTEGVAVTNGPVTLTVLQAVFEPGYTKEEKWINLTTKTPIENGTISNATWTIGMPGFIQGSNSPGGQGDFGFRMTGFFVAPTSGDYVFFMSSDDDSDLFLSTDESSAHKRWIAQEASWSNPFSWNTPGTGGSTASQKRSDQFVSTTGGPTLPPITLVAGHKYYMEVDHHNGAAGGTHVGVTYKLTSEADPNDGVPPRLVGNLVGINVVRSTNIGFVQQPANVTGTIGGYVTLVCQGTNDSVLPASRVNTDNERIATNNFTLYQWYRNGIAITNIASATASNMTLGPLEPSDDGAVFMCKIRGLGYADASFNPIWSNSVPVTLTLTSTQQVFEPGYVQHDLWTNQTTRVTIEEGLEARPPRLSYATTKFAGPTNNATAPNNYVQRISGMFIPPADGNYTFVVNSDDENDFWISSDSAHNNRRLVAQEGGWSNPYNWNGPVGNAGGGLGAPQKYSSTWTAPGSGGQQPWGGGIPLQHSQKYYIEDIHHNGGGGNNVEVTFFNQFTESGPNNGDDTRLTNSVIGFYAPRVPAMIFTQQPASQTNASGGNSVTFTAFGTSSTPAIQIGTAGDFQPMLANPTNPANTLLFQWYRNGSPIPGATSSNYTLVPLLPSDNGAQFFCAMRVLGYADNTLTPTWSNSLTASLTVVTDTVPPLLTYAATLVNSNQDPAQFIVDVTFNEWLDTATANNPANYTVAGASVLSASVASNHRTVQLLLNQMPTLPLDVTVNNVKDVSGNTIAPSSTTPINPVGLTFQDIGNVGNAGTFGTAGIDPAYPSSAYVTASNGFIVSAEGSDIFGTNDGFNFGYELKTNDFDVVVRVVSNGHSSNFAKAGLMVRETLVKNSRNWSVINDPATADGIPAPDGSGLGANNIECNMRQTNNATTVSWKTNTSTTIPRYPNAWVRITRIGNVLTAYSSSNMVDWVALGAYNTATNANGALPSVVYVGLCTTAHNNDSATAVPPPPPFKYYNTAEYADYTSSFVATLFHAQMTASLSGGNIVISWTPAGGHLESTPALNGVGLNWQSLGTANPSTNPITSGSQFFRVATP